MAVEATSVASSFVGRRDERAQLVHHVAQRQRLCTLVGPGGIGKTRLALEVAQQTEGLFVDASRARTERGLVQAVATQVLGSEGPVDANVTSVSRGLQHRRPPLVVVDNLEQAYDAVPATVGAWIAATPATAWITTSRRPLQLQNEQVIRLAPLAEDDATRVFTQSAPPELRDGLPQSLVREVIRLLDGIPLALEVAAARLSVLDLPQLHQHLSTHLSVLRDPTGRRPDRHRTLDATLRWSWDLLAPSAQDALVQISVFPDAFDLDAATAVLDLGPHGLLDALQTLVAHSLVHATRDEQGMRYRLLATTRQFASDLLDEATRQSLRARFEAWVLHRSRELASRAGQGDRDAMRALYRIGDDLDLVVDAALDRHDRDTLLVAADLAWPVWNARNQLDHAREVVRRTLELPGPMSRAVTRVMSRHALVLARAGRFDEARDIGHQIRAFAGDDDVALRDTGTAVIARHSPHAEAAPLWISLLESTNPRSRRQAVRALSRAASHRGDAEEALAYSQQALAMVEGQIWPPMEASAWGEHARACTRAGRHDEADTAWATALAVAREVGSARGICLAILEQAESRLVQGRIRDAMVSLDEAREPVRRLGFVDGEASQVVLSALAGDLLGDPEAADDARTALRLRTSLPSGGWFVTMSALAAVVLAAGAPDEAEQALAEAAATVEQGTSHLLDGGSASALVDLARALVAVPRPASRSSFETARRAFLAAIVDAPMRGTDAGLLRMWATQRADALADPDRTYLVAPDGAWFDPPGHARVDLHHRQAHHGILAALLRAFREGEGTPVTRDALIAAGWPDQQLVPDAAGNRLRVTLSFLRKAGLDALERHAGGWRLSPETRLWVVAG